MEGYPFRAMPLVDTAYTILADSVRPDSLGNYTKKLNGGNPVVDSIHHTYLEITHFMFKNQQRNATGERVLVVTNKRTWPTDWDHSTPATKYWDGNYGLGPIDVRLPVLRLKNTTGVVADSFIVERVGESYAWRDTGAFGQDLQLQWLEPGWGAMYRITPLASGVSGYGTSFSNAVRSLNTSSPSTNSTRYLTYERDSVVYLRALSSGGKWGKEFMISDAADLDSTSSKRNGYNLFPALATSYNGYSLMVVWEHHDSVSGNATVEACYLDTLLRASDTLLPDTTRMPLSLPRTLTANWMRLAPSIVGIDSGYVVSWSRLPLKGIEMVAVRDTASPSRAIHVSLPLKIIAEQIDVGFAPDTNAWHSTLAYVPTRTNQVAISTSEGAGPYSTLAVWNVAHLAYQQGIPDVDPTSFIFYNKVGALFPSGQRPVTTAWRTEHVTKDLPGCRFLHPCIAADSARIGVAFENHRSGYRLATLRFRDSLNGAAMRWGLQWKTPTYSWGWDYLADWKRFSVIQQYYERPSLTQFPAIDRNDLLPDSGGQLQGGLTWMWTNPPTSASGKSLLKLYRYGWTKPGEPGPGQYPTMTLSPYVEASPWENSSLLYRHDTTRRFLRAGRRYYPAFVLNTPTEKSQLFQNSATRNRIYSYGILMRNIDALGINECGIKIGGGFHHDFTATPPAPPNTPQPPKTPGLPPTFFGAEAKLDTTVEHIATVTRSGVFTADTGSVTIGRTIVGSSDGVSWLNSFAYDTARNSPADVWMMTELVRVSDSSVVWRGDTVTARQIGDTTLDEAVEIPVGSVVSPGTAVFVRMRMEVSATIDDYSFDAGFHNAEQYDTAGGLGKSVRIRRAFQREATRGAEGSRMQVEVRPNPTGERAEVLLRAREEGAVQLRLYTMLGQQVRELQSAEAAAAGEYLQPINLGGLPSGIYLLVAQQGDHKASVKVTVGGR
ncbi:MAG: T9SS type A sorting domain-containing protein [Armatimonadetes bacterium]|nr:T9SS type A sorting domain-containing protein [Armatimonadota bacterium]